jgi:hypothetical protein
MTDDCESDAVPHARNQSICFVQPFCRPISFQEPNNSNVNWAELMCPRTFIPSSPREATRPSQSQLSLTCNSHIRKTDMCLTTNVLGITLASPARLAPSLACQIHQTRVGFPDEGADWRAVLTPLQVIPLFVSAQAQSKPHSWVMISFPPYRDAKSHNLTALR